MSYCEPTDASAESAFGHTHIVEPQKQHTHTAIVLHGRGSTGEEFADEILSSELSDRRTLPERFPTWRWVFPSSRTVWSTVFEEHMPSWFDSYSAGDSDLAKVSQIKSLKASVSHVRSVLASESGRLGGRSEHIYLCGISQGGAVGMWTLLQQPKDRKLGAFVGISTWLPLAEDIRATLPDTISVAEPSGGEPVSHPRGLLGGIDGLWAEQQEHNQPREIPVFLGHGNDDAYVDVELGRDAKKVLTNLGFNVQWKEYSGAEQEGHWLKIPDELDDIAVFLDGLSGRSVG